MIGLGGAIGTGLFMGSGIAIGYAGPGVLISYLVAAAIALIMMYSLSEMAVTHPTAGSFGTYAELYLNRWAGFIVRFTYWAAQSIAIGGEAVAIGLYMSFWFPDIPVWMWTTGFGFAIIYANMRSVSTFGTLEYWLSAVKVFAICAFIVFGLAVVFGIGRPAAGFDHYTAHDGFLPHGFWGVWMGVLIAISSSTASRSSPSPPAKRPTRPRPCRAPCAPCSCGWSCSTCCRSPSCWPWCPGPKPAPRRSRKAPSSRSLPSSTSSTQPRR